MTLSFKDIPASEVPKRSQISAATAAERAEYDNLVLSLVQGGPAKQIDCPAPTEEIQSPARSVSLKVARAITRVTGKSPKDAGIRVMADGGFVYVSWPAAAKNGSKAAE